MDQGRALSFRFYKSGGHVCNVENQRGRTVMGRMHYVDAQTGDRVNIKQHLGMANPSTVRLVRTDNLRLSERQEVGYCQVRKKKRYNFV